MNDLLLLDGRHLLWRTADAFKELCAEVDGEEVPTGAIYGFLSVALQIRKRWMSKIIIVAWEGSKNFRRTLYPQYKQRPIPTEEQEQFLKDMDWQQGCIKLLLQSAGVRQYAGRECEADDVLGTIATRMAARGRKVIVYTGDSDLRQLVTKSIIVVAPTFGRKEKTYSYGEVIKKHGVKPTLIADLKALAGDNSDNIPGVRGIGPKKAVELITRYGDLEDVIEAARAAPDDWPLNEKLRQLLVEGADLVRLFKTLTTIRTDVDLLPVRPRRDKLKLVAGLERYALKSLTVPFRLTELLKMGGQS